MSEIKEKSAVAAATAATETDNESTEIITQAVEKVKFPYSGNDKYAKAIAQNVIAVLGNFCRQNEEFARAVLRGESSENCIKAIANQIKGKQSVSDIEVYQKAVEFYFPGAVIENRMTIHMSKYDLEDSETAAPQAPPKAKKSIDLSLDSLLDW